MIKAQLFIDGKTTNSASNEYFQVINPANQQVIGEVADANKEDTEKAIKAAKVAFAKWKTVPANERNKKLMHLYNLLCDHVDEIARVVTLENGKPFVEAQNEVRFGNEYVRWFAEEARRLNGEIIQSPVAGKRFFVQKEPVGVVAAITPWNFPAAMVLRKLAPALAAGCSMVLKPAPETPLTAAKIAEICGKAELMPGLFNVLSSNRAQEIAECFYESNDVRKITFTGSTEVGKKLMRGAAAGMKHVSFELGGNAPFIVFDDANIDKAVEHATFIKFMRVGGQSCICANRIFVQKNIEEEFCKKFIAKVAALRVGEGNIDGMQVGPMITSEARERIKQLVITSVKQGAHVAIGGGVHKDLGAKGWFFEPTVLRQVKDSMDICQQEIFGPIAPILTFDTVDEVIERANNTQYGLASYVFTENLSKALNISDKLEYGLVWINDASGYTHEVPFGGVKLSGLGREGGRSGIEAYLEEKTIIIG